MAPTSLALRLGDILKAIDDTAEFLDGVDFGAYQKDAKTRRSVERCLEIVSEASRHIPAELTANDPEFLGQRCVR
jgi:uncharacterized protein with HEPN domain